MVMGIKSPNMLCLRTLSLETVLCTISKLDRGIQNSFME